MDRIVFLTLAAAAVSCVPIDGGSVEASWVVRTEDGRAVSDCACADPAIPIVRLSLVGVEGEVKGTEPCKDRIKCGFACQRHTGATPFDIPPGFYLISLLPTDVAGNDLTQTPPRGVSIPAPVLREVVRGQPTQLDALAIVASCNSACSANKDRVCTSQ